MVTRTVTETFDDINGQPGAARGWVGYFDGKDLIVCEIDLVRDGWRGLADKFSSGMAKYLAARRVRRVKRSDVHAFLSALAGDIPNPDKSPAELKRTELPPQGATKTALAKAAKTTQPDGHARGTRRILGLTGKPLSPGEVARLRRPGIKPWWQRNKEILGLPDGMRPIGGTLPKVVREAYDRYGGLDVTQEILKPEDMERLKATKG